jgi:hypothetical protein
MRGLLSVPAVLPDRIVFRVTPIHSRGSRRRGGYPNITALKLDAPVWRCTELESYFPSIVVNCIGGYGKNEWLPHVHPIVQVNTNSRNHCEKKNTISGYMPVPLKAHVNDQILLGP